MGRPLEPSRSCCSLSLSLSTPIRITLPLLRRPPPSPLPAITMALRVLNPNAEVLNKFAALHMNINTVKGLQDILKTNLGPKGTIKMLVGGAGDIKLTKEGNTLLKEMQIQNPMAIIITRTTVAQDDTSGDGTTSTVLFIGELMKVNIDFETEPIGTSKDGKKVFFRDIWPTTEEIADVMQSSVLRAMFKSTYEAITGGNPMWNELSVPSSTLYTWDSSSTYIHELPYFKSMMMSPPGPYAVKDAYCLLNFGDSITTDHISPAGMIQKDSPATKYLMEQGVDRKDFNSYGSHRGNDEVMARGTFAS